MAAWDFETFLSKYKALVLRRSSHLIPLLINFCLARRCLNMTIPQDSHLHGCYYFFAVESFSGDANLVRILPGNYSTYANGPRKTYFGIVDT